MTATASSVAHAPAAPGGLDARHLALREQIDLDLMVDTHFAARVVERGIAHLAHVRVSTVDGALSALPAPSLASSRGAGGAALLVDLADAVGPDCLAALDSRGQTVWARLAAPTPALLAACEEWVRRQLPPAVQDEDHRVPVAFWSFGRHGAVALTRSVGVPRWSEIAGNYPDRVRSRLAALMGGVGKADEVGRLILWHGPPGTGKTWALRALGWEWRRWCELHYVVDPEVFLREPTDYMLRVLLDEDEDDEDRERWRLLVLEDTGELLSADARARAGQGQSRLLNVVDGLIGQGLRALVLVTTNEAVGRLHPAVARPGRCAAAIEFGPFPATEAGAWLSRRGVDPGRAAGAAASLASLYSCCGEPAVAPAEPRRFGFA